MHCPFQAKESGLSLIELLIAMGLLGGLVAFGLQNYIKTQEMRKFVEDRSVITDLEEGIRRAVFTNAALVKSAKEQLPLRNCLQANGTACPQGEIPIELWISEDRKATGRYHGDGRPCSDLNCLIEVNAQFQGLCGSSSSCDMAKYLLVKYQISADGTIVRRGQLRRSFERTNQSDDNLACDLDQFNRTKFVSQLRPSSLQCIESPPLNRKVQGVQAGDCQAGREILAGFDEAGAPICQPIKFSVGNR